MNYIKIPKKNANWLKKWKKSYRIGEIILNRACRWISIQRFSLIKFWLMAPMIFRGLKNSTIGKTLLKSKLPKSVRCLIGSLWDTPSLRVGKLWASIDSWASKNIWSMDLRITSSGCFWTKSLRYKRRGASLSMTLSRCGKNMKNTINWSWI